MFVLALDEQDRKDYQKRIALFKFYVRHLKEIFIGNKTEVLNVLKKIK